MGFGCHLLLRACIIVTIIGFFSVIVPRISERLVQALDVVDKFYISSHIFAARRHVIRLEAALRHGCLKPSAHAHIHHLAELF